MGLCCALLQVEPGLMCISVGLLQVVILTLGSMVEASENLLKLVSNEVMFSYVGISGFS